MDDGRTVEVRTDDPPVLVFCLSACLYSTRIDCFDYRTCTGSVTRIDTQLKIRNNLQHTRLSRHNNKPEPDRCLLYAAYCCNIKSSAFAFLVATRVYSSLEVVLLTATLV